MYVTRLYAFIAALCLWCIPGRATAGSDSLTLVTWNVKMLPSFLLHLKHAPVKRARIIPALVARDSADVLCFQEMFDRRAVRIIKKALHSAYPYTAGPANRHPANGKLSSGVMFFSRLPLRQLGETDFSNCDKEDCFARKGGLLCEVVKNGRPFQLLGTHCEAGGTKEMKKIQLLELKGLTERYYCDTVTRFYCGDFNCHKTDTILYPFLLSALQASDGPFSSALQHTTSPDCDMRKSKKRKSGRQVDYILVSENTPRHTAITRYVVRYTQQWHPHHRDLSDHYAIRMAYHW